MAGRGRQDAHALIPDISVSLEDEDPESEGLVCIAAPDSGN
jgi:hypothetical protein